MSDVDQLTALGQMLATSLVSSYGSKVPGGSLVFLPVGVPVADDIVQGGVVNPTQLQQWLGLNFDFPFTVSSGDAAVIAQEDAHGTASFIYSLAVTQAQPIGDPSDPAWQRVAGELNAARQLLGPVPAQMNFVCEPDDWPTPAAPYWANFDSAQIASTSTSQPAPAPAPAPAPTPTPTPTPTPSPPFWQIRRFEPIGVGIRPIDRFEAPNMVGRPMYAASAIPVSELASSAVLEDTAVAQQSAVSVPVADVAFVRPQFDIARIMNGSTTVTNVTTSATSSITIHLQHQYVSFGRYSSGQPCWNGGLLADPGWYVPGFSAGGILPVPISAATGAVYALPVAMIVVSQLKVSGQWSQDALTALSAPGGSLGPLALLGAVPSTAADGVTISFEQDAMQVVALLCSPLPVIPSSGAPTSDSSAASGSSTGSATSSNGSTANGTAIAGNASSPPPDASTSAPSASTSASSASNSVAPDSTGAAVATTKAASSSSSGTSGTSETPATSGSSATPDASTATPPAASAATTTAASAATPPAAIANTPVEATATAP